MKTWIIHFVKSVSSILFSSRKEETPPNPKPFPMLGLDIFFFLDNFSFCVCQLERKCMCRIHIDQKSGGCLYIIQQIKGWRNFILIWGQQTKVTEDQHACSSAIQIKANARWHLGAAELAGLVSSNTSLVTEARCRTCTDISHKKGWHLHLTALLTRDPVHLHVK